MKPRRAPHFHVSHIEIAMLRLGVFQFKNDIVLLLAASPADAIALAERLESALENGSFKLPIHEIAQVSKRHPAKLFVSPEPASKLGENEYWWQCNFVTVEKLKAIAQRAGEQYFELSRPCDLFSVSCLSYYNEQWWQTYG